MARFKIGVMVDSFRLPIPDGGVLPELAPVSALIQQIVPALQTGENVVVHCNAGIGRTGISKRS